MSHNFTGNFWIIFALKKIYKNDDDVIFAAVCTKQACSLKSGEYDLYVYDQKIAAPTFWILHSAVLGFQ